jgi:hypothetical protein
MVLRVNENGHDSDHPDEPVENGSQYFEWFHGVRCGLTISSAAPGHLRPIWKQRPNPASAEALGWAVLASTFGHGNETATT